MRNYSVYVLTAPNGKKYVGMTMRNPKKRWNAGNGYYYNELLYADIKKYGWENFDKQVISGFTKDEACRAEIRLIASFKTQDASKGYNIEFGGMHEPLSKRTKQKMSEAHKGLYRSPEYCKHIAESKMGAKNGMYGKKGALSPSSVKVVAYNNDEILRFDGIAEACRSLNLSKNAFKNVSACCRGKRRTAYGYTWRYANDCEE